MPDGGGGTIHCWPPFHFMAQGNVWASWKELHFKCILHLKSTKYIVEYTCVVLYITFEICIIEYICIVLCELCMCGLVCELCMCELVCM